ncbi:phosphoglycerate kinase [Aestuariivirga sp.]|uniref:phosphoglycerate kinase n=1 Tax=Aestuariivirga sp. TaxID=2650926 RepID=UPI003015E726
MPGFRTLDDVTLSGKRVLCRVDLNVPIADGKVTDATRIERVIPTLREIMNKGGALIVLAHFDRPKGKVVPEMSLRPVAAELEKHLGVPVKFVFTDWQTAPKVDVKPGECVLMENTRYNAGEEKNDEGFSKMLASLGDIYVNDAFSAAHRAHSSTEGIAHLMPAYAGRAMEAELKALQLALETPKRPVIAIVGGAKVSTKLDLLGNLVKKVDALVIGGAMANTFLMAQGKNVGRSLAERDLVDTAQKIMDQDKANNRQILLPVDAVVAEKFEANAPSRVVDVDHIGGADMMLDIGPKSVEQVISVLARAKTLVWNGPFGAFEMEPFDNGTVEVAEAAAELTQDGKLVTVAGGGDTVAALNVAGVVDRLTYVSTAGGAFLEWLEGKPLPGVEVLRQK